MINPPSGTTVADVWNAIKAGEPTHVKMIFGQNQVLEDRDIEQSTGLIVTDILNGEMDITFGKSVSKQLRTEIIVSERTAGIPWTSEFELQMGVEIGGSTVWTSIGYFSGDRPNNIETREKVEFTAYDRMERFEKLSDDYWSGLDFTTPLSLSDMYHALCTFVGIGYETGDELSASFNRTYSTSPMDMTGYTCRDVLAWMAEAVGCYAKITAAGNCKLVWFGNATNHVVSRDEQFHIEHADMYSGIVWDEFDENTWNDAESYTWDEVSGDYQSVYGIRAVKIKQTNLGMDVDYPSAQPWNVYTIMDNPFLQIEDMVQDPVTYVKPIYDRLEALGGMLPMNVDCVGCWCVEAGDIITVNVTSEQIHMPIFTKEMRWFGAIRDEYETTGEKFRAIINDSQKQRVINNRNIKLYVDGNYYDVVSGIEIESDGVTISGDKFVKIISQNEETRFDENGITRIDSNNQKIIFGEDQRLDLSVSSAVLAGADNDNEGYVTIYTKPANATYSAILKFSSKYYSTAQSFAGYFSALETIGSAGHLLGTTDHPFGYLFAPVMVGSKSTMSANGQTYYGGSVTFVLNGRFDPRASGFLGDYMNIVISYFDGYDSDVNVYVGKSGQHSYIRFIFLKAQTLTCTSSATIPTLHYNNLIQDSSREIKHDIKALPSYGDKIDKLNPVSFVYDNDSEEKERVGLIYEDTLDVMPGICTKDEGNKAISYVELIPVLLKEIQDLRKRVATLEEKLNEREV